MTQVLPAITGAVGGASARGASHIRRNKPNQDARGGWVCGQWSIIAVADGHGGAPYFRSDRGSRFAVEAVREAFTALTADGAAGVAELARLQAGAAELPARIVSSWRRAVTSDIQSDPDPQLNVSDPHVAYGATCVAAAFGPGVSVFIQIGDGDLLASPAGGDLIKPLPDDEGLEGEQTYSVCNVDAVAHFRIKLFGTPHPLAAPDFAMASSDGLAKSFAQDAQFFDVARGWRSFVQKNGMQATCADLESWLARCSEMGSGDDITMMMFCNAAARPPVAVHEAQPKSGGCDELAAVPLAPHVARPATGGFGLGAVALAALLAAALAAGGIYFVVKGQRAPPPVVQTPVQNPPAISPSIPHQGEQPPPKVEPAGMPPPNGPAQPKELSNPARPAAPDPSRGVSAPVAVPAAPPLPVAPPEPAK